MNHTSKSNYPTWAPGSRPCAKRGGTATTSSLPTSMRSTARSMGGTGTVIKEFLTLLEQWNLSEKQEFQMIEVLTRIVKADDKVDNSELHFIHNVRRKLKISDESLIVRFPRHVGLLIGLEHHGETDIQPGLQGLDFGNVDNLFTSS